APPAPRARASRSRAPTRSAAAASLVPRLPPEDLGGRLALGREVALKRHVEAVHMRLARGPALRGAAQGIDESGGVVVGEALERAAVDHAVAGAYVVGSVGLEVGARLEGGRAG